LILELLCVALHGRVMAEDLFWLFAF